jgi:hypothetical protein
MTIPATRRANADELGRVDELLYADPCGNQMNKSQQGMAEFLIACGNTAKLFEFIEEPVDFLPSLVQGMIIVSRGRTGALWR